MTKPIIFVKMCYKLLYVTQGVVEAYADVTLKLNFEKLKPANIF